MNEHAAATFAIKSWDEKPYDEMKGSPKLTRASVTKSYEGDIAGEGKMESLIMYRDDGSAVFTGLERVVDYALQADYDLKALSSSTS